MRNAISGGTTLIAANRTRERSYETEGELTWRFNAAYRVSDDINTWVAIGRGRRPEALSPRDCTVASSPTCTAETQTSGFELVANEIFDNVEAGMFGRFLDNRLQVSTSAYYGEYKDFQTNKFDASEGTFVVANSGNATQYGAEIEGQFWASDEIALFGSYAYNFSEYDQTDSDGNPLQFAGNQFRISPLNSFALGAEFNWPLATWARSSSCRPTPGRTTTISRTTTTRPNSRRPMACSTSSSASTRMAASGAQASMSRTRWTRNT